MATSANTEFDVESFRSLTKLAEESSQELERTRRELTEINVLIKQTTSEMERANTRATEIANKLREVESATDNYTRAEIREVYAAAQEAEMRLFLMKGQLEQLEYKRQSLERYETQFRNVVEVTTSILDATEKGAIPTSTTNEELINTRDPLIKTRPFDHDMGNIIDAQEDERQRIARRIHDGPAQDLANLILRAEICERLLASEPEIAVSELAGLKSMVVDTLREIRQFIFDLRPMILDDLGLVPTLRRHVESLAARSGTSIKLSISGPERRLPTQMEIALFRITQEAIDNSVIHGKATEILVTIEISDGVIRLAIADNGTGFDVSKVLSAAKATGLYGLAGMKERVQAIGGKISVDSNPGQGTTLSVEAPL